MVYEFLLNLFDKIIYCSQTFSSLEISASVDSDKYIINIIQSQIETDCKNLPEFFDLALKDENSLSYTKAVLGLKDINGKIEISMDELNRGIYKIVLPFNPHVSDRD